MCRALQKDSPTCSLSFSVYNTLRDSTVGFDDSPVFFPIGVGVTVVTQVTGGLPARPCMAARDIYIRVTLKVAVQNRGLNTLCIRKKLM